MDSAKVPRGSMDLYTIRVKDSYRKSSLGMLEEAVTIAEACMKGAGEDDDLKVSQTCRPDARRGLRLKGGAGYMGRDEQSASAGPTSSCDEWVKVELDALGDTPPSPSAYRRSVDTRR